LKDIHSSYNYSATDDKISHHCAKTIIKSEIYIQFKNEFEKEIQVMQIDFRISEHGTGGKNKNRL